MRYTKPFNKDGNSSATKSRLEEVCNLPYHGEQGEVVFFIEGKQVVNVLLRYDQYMTLAKRMCIKKDEVFFVLKNNFVVWLILFDH